MFRKNRTLILVGILVVLAIAYAINYFSDKNDRSFKDTITDFDANLVTYVKIHTPSQMQTVELQKQENDWRVIDGSNSYPADTLGIQNLVHSLSGLKTKRFAGKSRAFWPKYEVTDSLSTQVTLKSDSKVVLKILLGKFDYKMPQNQNPQAMQRQQADVSSYVRLDGENEVYAVDGFLKMSFNREAMSFRNRKLLSMNANDMTRLEFKYADRQFTLSKEENKWMLNGTPTDSSATVKYLSAISRLNTQDFVNESLVTTSNPAYSLNIHGNNMVPVLIQAFPVADTAVAYVLNSSDNRESYFNGKKSGLFEKIFVSEFDFFSE